ncbi:hypothetical protein KL866_19705, partial [Alteromonas sp. ALT199]|uniref:hypothetical protein n=1 Tax=Alteromonas sp. ALT199 TaxID=1298865 RepID=UPI001BE6E395
MGSRRVIAFLFKLFAMPIKEGVKPHQKLSAAGTLIEAAKDVFTARFRGHNNHELNRRHKKSA